MSTSVACSLLNNIMQLLLAPEGPCRVARDASPWFVARIGIKPRRGDIKPSTTQIDVAPPGLSAGQTLPRPLRAWLHDIAPAGLFSSSNAMSCITLSSRKRKKRTKASQQPAIAAVHLAQPAEVSQTPASRQFGERSSAPPRAHHDRRRSPDKSFSPSSPSPMLESLRAERAQVSLAPHRYPGSLAH